MKNILGKEEDLELFDKEGRMVYQFWRDSDGYSWERTYDSDGNQLTFKNSDGNWIEKTYDLKGNPLTYKDSNGFSWEKTYDSNGKELTFNYNINHIHGGFNL